MEHSKLFPYAELSNRKLTIREIAVLVLNFYRKLAHENDNFNVLYIVSEKKALYDGIDINEAEAIKKLAEEILNQNIEDIKKQDKVESPNIDYSRESDILFSLEAKVNHETLLSLFFAFGTKVKSSIGAIVTNVICFDSFNKVYVFIKAVNDVFNVDYSTIKIKERDFTRKVRDFEAPLGWITYFSNNYNISIPDDLEGIEYEHTEKGKYLILTREDFTVDKESYETHKQKLLDLMEEIKQRVPENSK